MDLLLKELNERYYYGECLNNGSLCAIEKVKEMINYKEDMVTLIDSITKEEFAFKEVNNKSGKFSTLYVKGYLLELAFIKERAKELNVA